MFQDLFAAIDGNGKVFSRDVARYFFGTWTNSSNANPTLAGLYCKLDSDVPGSESLNVFSRSPNAPPSYKLGKMDGESVFVHYKGGTIDGFTGCVYVSVRHRTSAIVHTNATGPIDFADHAARCILQEALDLKPPVDFVSETRQDRSLATAFLGSLENFESDRLEWTDSVEPFAGEYEHVIHKQRIIVTPSGDITFKGSSAASLAMKVYASGSKLRIFPSQNELAVDRRSEWKDLEFEKVKRSDQVFLVGAGATDYYALVRT